MAANPPLTGLRVLELAGLAPGLQTPDPTTPVTDIKSAGPLCGLLLSSYGASVLRVDRPPQALSGDLLAPHKTSIALDLNAPASLAVFLSLIPKTDVLIDSF